jgi:CDP-4-dehydro-6-deoxyglucose reductase, E3
LTSQEKLGGWILSCVRSATSDVTLEVADLGGVALPTSRTLPCRIQSLERLASDVLQVLLRIPPGSRFNFLPGQYIDVIGTGGIRRSYSLARSDASENCLELHVRAVPGGAMSGYWFGAAKVNDLLRINGPLGTFFLRNIEGLELVFLATGTGIAPVKSMLESIDSMPLGQRPHSVATYWGGRTKADLYWDVSGSLRANRYTAVLSRGEDDWVGARGYVQQVFMSDSPTLSQTLVYACGSDAMIHSAREVLIGAGLPSHQFLSDAFVCSASS